MRDVDSPIVCSGNWGYLRRKMNVRRNTRLSKFRAGYKQSDPYLDNSVLEREDVFDFMCGMPPTMQ
jgi:hypothetical protein